MYSQIFLTASVREASGAPRNWRSAGDTGETLRIPVTRGGFRGSDDDDGAFFLVGDFGRLGFAAEEGLGATAALDDAAIRALQPFAKPRIEDMESLALALSLSIEN